MNSSGQATMSASALKDYHTVRHSSGLACDEALETAIERFRTSSERFAWVCAEYSTPQLLTARAEGVDGLVGLAAQLHDDSVAYAGLVVHADGGCERDKISYMPRRPIVRVRITRIHHASEFVRILLKTEQVKNQVFKTPSDIL